MAYTTKDHLLNMGLFVGDVGWTSRSINCLGNTAKQMLEAEKAEERQREAERRQREAERRQRSGRKQRQRKKSKDKPKKKQKNVKDKPKKKLKNKEKLFKNYRKHMKYLIELELLMKMKPGIICI